MKHGYVYILTNTPYGTLYIGVTSDMIRRDYEHKQGIYPGFTKKYGLKTLVHLETFESMEAAIAREKQLKRWHRDWKINLINAHNPQWKNIELVEPSSPHFGSSHSGADAPWMDAETTPAFAGAEGSPA
jgi:putative endonuclease